MYRQLFVRTISTNQVKFLGILLLFAHENLRMKINRRYNADLRTTICVDEVSICEWTM